MNFAGKLKEQARKFPLNPGVYLFIGSNGEALYVGRTVSLKKRIMNYFRDDIDPRIKEMVSLAKRLKYRETNNLLEAIVLEANLIKKYWPKYNVKDRDNRSFIYIAIPSGDFPRPLIVRGREIEKFYQTGKKGGVKIFGPYQSLTLVKSALRIIRRIFPYSACKINSGKACFDYQIGLCPGACIGAISKEDYKKNIKNIELLLGGKNKALLKKLKKENPEKAGSLTHLEDAALIANENFLPIGGFSRVEGYDISHLSGKETYGSLVVFVNGEASKKDYRLFRIKKVFPNDDLRALEEMVLRRLNHPEWAFPDLMLIDGGKPQIDFISKSLKAAGRNIPIIGISKYQNDKLVFPAGAKKNFKELTANAKKTLIKVRDEAHRFAISASRRARNKKIPS
ncbi:GIY-YIG nuclease family protein [Patescibacteria group bacterium]|nr:GIY-YIG nuclease family protein [Patescibacteria group bacterium]MCL5733112.1 GIY-YIG nuclease family protein [Patescibacteria group bacterium]